MEGLFNLLLLGHILLGCWTWMHAQNHDESGWWGVLVVLVGFVGLIFYSITLSTE